MSAAAQLHRDGVAQVVGYFGPVYDRQSTEAETAFYREIGRGRRTRDAVRAARQVMAQPFVLVPGEGKRDAGAAEDGRAWAAALVPGGGEDGPLAGLEAGDFVGLGVADDEVWRLAEVLSGCGEEHRQ